MEASRAVIIYLFLRFFSFFFPQRSVPCSLLTVSLRNWKSHSNDGMVEFPDQTVMNEATFQGDFQPRARQAAPVSNLPSSFLFFLVGVNRRLRGMSRKLQLRGARRRHTREQRTVTASHPALTLTPAIGMWERRSDRSTSLSAFAAASSSSTPRCTSSGMWKNRTKRWKAHVTSERIFPTDLRWDGGSNVRLDNFLFIFPSM